MLVDDAPTLRDGLTLLLRSAGWRVVGATTGMRASLALAPICDPDLIIVGAQARGVSGLLVCAALRRRCPRQRIVLCAERLDEPLLQAAVRAGVDALLPRTAAWDTLAETLRRVARGERPILRTLAMHTAREATSGDLLAWRTSAGIPVGEILVLDGLARGLSEAEIAAELGLSPRTIRTRLQRTRSRFDLHSRTQLLRFAVEQRWVGRLAPLS
jgi:DNA-binding NarL/FixJ family response regulator